uniref:Late embryogenesis abundant protein, LEA-14 n=1 Tax=Tanacetum cinerariifolium TaxID=118510 RepID=A0A699JW98_TANCI|nr:late embryogenesis abundant protein, LEA-14 [Tanacetum cinerariifolium]
MFVFAWTDQFLSFGNHKTSGLELGLVIASAYNKVVVNLSDAGGCSTSFPLWSRPPQSESRETIVIAHVDGNRYIRVRLREGQKKTVMKEMLFDLDQQARVGGDDGLRVTLETMIKYHIFMWKTKIRHMRFEGFVKTGRNFTENVYLHKTPYVTQ